MDNPYLKLGDWLLVICDLINRIFIVTAGITTLRFLHSTITTAIFQLSAESRGGQAVHTIMTLECDSRSKGEIDKG